MCGHYSHGPCFGYHFSGPGWHPCWCQATGPYWPAISKEQEITWLEKRLQGLEEEVASLQERISELKK